MEKSVAEWEHEQKTFQMVKESQAVPVDLVIVAVKFTGLEACLKTMEKVVGPDTVIISVLNGISSEEYIGAKFGFEKVLHMALNLRKSTIQIFMILKKNNRKAGAFRLFFYFD